jgi:ATP-dependent DNA helicase PIF1
MVMVVLERRLSGGHCQRHCGQGAKLFLQLLQVGIAALLIPGGRTAHSRFGIPINIDEYSTCEIGPKDPLAALIRRARLIIWDEAPMMHKHCFEAVDRTLKDI